jgi:hypothetical protein
MDDYLHETVHRLANCNSVATSILEFLKFFHFSFINPSCRLTYFILQSWSRFGVHGLSRDVGHTQNRFVFLVPCA